MIDEEKIREQYDTEIKTLVLQRDHLLKKIKTLNKIEKEGVHSKDDAKKLMEGVLCWGNLSYCCRPKTDDGDGKKCMWRDRVLSLLGISKETFIAAKEKAVDGLLPSL